MLQKIIKSKPILIVLSVLGLGAILLVQSRFLKFEQMAYAEPPGQTSITLTPSADAYLDKKNPDTNYGTASILAVDGYQNSPRSLIRFNTSAITTDISKASLKLYFSIGGRKEIYFYKLLKDWQENEVTFNKRNSQDNWTCGACEWHRSGDFDVSLYEYVQGPVFSQGKWYEWDITAFVKDWISNPEKNYGLMITNDEGWRASRSEFSSRQGSNPPQLVIELTENTPIARAGSDIERDGGSVSPNATIQLDGSKSTDSLGGALNYLWEIITKPYGASAAFDNSKSIVPQLSINTAGRYTIQLTVTNSQGKSSTDTLVVKNFYVRPEHPRIIVTPEIIQELKQKKKGTAEWNNIFKDANSALSKTISSTSVMDIPVLGLAYLLLKDDDLKTALTYADKVKSIMHYFFDYPGIAWAYSCVQYAPEDTDGENILCSSYTDENGNSPYKPNCGELSCNYPGETRKFGNCYGPPGSVYAACYNARIQWALGLGYDWIYDQLNEDEKEQFIHRINKAFDEFFLGGIYKDYASIHCRLKVQNWGSGGFILQAAMGLATYGDNPKAKFLIDDLRYSFYEKIFKRELGTAGTVGEPVEAYPYLTVAPPLHGYKGGYQMEGVGYAGDLVKNYIIALEAVRTATGENLMRDHNYPKELIDYYPQMTFPNDKKLWYAYGNDESQYIGTTQLSAMLALHHEFKDNHLMALYNLNPTSGYYKIEKFLWHDSSAQAQSFADLPLTYRVEGTNLISSRSDWGENATWVIFRAGAHDMFEGTRHTGVGHDQYDAGHFVIYKNGYLVTELLGGDAQTDYANTLYIGAQGSNTPSSRPTFPTGKLLQYEEKGNDYLYAKSDFRNTYNEVALVDLGDPSKVKVDFARRSFVYLKPDYVVVFDRVETIAPVYRKEFRLHFLQEPLINTDKITIAGNSKLFQKVLLPEISRLDISKTFENGGSVTGKFWRLKIVPTTDAEEELFLNVFQAGDTSQSEMIGTERIDAETGNMTGAKLSLAVNDERVIMFSKTAMPQTRVIYSLENASSTIKHLITDLTPNYQYNIYKDSQLLETKSSSVQGTLYFTSQGASRFEISQGGPTEPPKKPDITLTKTADKTTAKTGEIITYTITYKNTGNGEARNVVITDPVPDGAEMSEILDNGKMQGNIVKWEIDTVTAGASGNVGLRVRVK